ncbi:MAG: hypothetical protein ACE5MH_03955 [Terriglobia bacterium]
MKGYKVGQQVKHNQYGLGTILRSDEDRTAIDFVDHGGKLFVTSLVKLEPAGPNEALPSRKRPRRSRPSAKRRLAKAAAR